MASVLVLVTATACSGGTSPGAARPTKTSTHATGPGTAATGSGSQGIPTNQQGLAACGDGPRFDHLPLALGDFRAFRPLGFTSVPIHVMPARFSAFSRALPGEQLPPAPVDSPGSVTVTAVLLTEFPATGATGYQVEFSPCRDTRFQFNHIGRLGPALAQAVDAATKTNCREFDSGQGNIARTCQANVAVLLTSGERIGWTDQFAGVDFVAIDYRSPPAAFANPKHYVGDFFHYVSPIPYFTPRLRTQLEARLASYDGTVHRTAKPVEGTYMQDVPGTAQGNWFLPGGSPAETNSSDGQLALVHDYIGADEPLISVGIGVTGLRSGLYSYAPRPAGTIDRQPSEISADGHVYCFDTFLTGRTVGALPLGTPNGVLLIAMPAPDRLDIELRSATTCTPSLTLSAAASHYQR